MSGSLTQLKSSPAVMAAPDLFRLESAPLPLPRLPLRSAASAVPGAVRPRPGRFGSGGFLDEVADVFRAPADCSPAKLHGCGIPALFDALPPDTAADREQGKDSWEP